MEELKIKPTKFQMDISGRSIERNKVKWISGGKDRTISPHQETKIDIS